ncbi:MAG: hypothetical protein FK730_06385 [Asgard group archaeon]|nr:hypothetical protein [Asgard group archaeon]
MTITRTYEYPCSSCGTMNSVETQDSITTWIYPELVQKILDDGYYFECSKCKTKNQIVKDILVNTRQGMYNMDTGANLETNVQLLIKYGVVDEQGNILDQEIKPRSEVQHDPSIAPIVEGIEKIVEEFRDGLLDENKEKSEEEKE